MKSLIVSLVFATLSLTVYSQNRIVLKDGSVLNHCRFNKIENGKLEYELQSSLHDIEIEKVNWVEKDTPMKYYIVDNALLAASDMKGTKEYEQAQEIEYYTHPEKFTNKSFRGNPAFIDSVQMAHTNEVDLKELGYQNSFENFHSPVSTILGIVAVPGFFTVVLPVATIVSATRPCNINSQPVPAYLKNNEAYVSGYRKGSVNKKLRNTGIGLGIGFVVLTVYLLEAIL